MNSALIAFGKIFSTLSKSLNLGAGSTWPGNIALELNSKFLQQILAKNRIKIILIAGTNGKTTTSKLIQEILLKNSVSVLRNKSGANLLNGIASTLIEHSDIAGKIDKEFAIFEVDENSLPLVLNELSPDYLILLDLFRDQLDRYGEINIIAKKWRDSVMKLSSKTTLILNSDDPLISYIGNGVRTKVKYFGLNETGSSRIQHASDSVYCPKCGSKLNYAKVFFSHLGIWSCLNCKLKRPNPDISNPPFFSLTGTYNKYNALAAVLTTSLIGIKPDKIKDALKNFKPAFGRQEIAEFKGKKVQFFLSKNPTSFNESLQTIVDNKAKNVLIVLNDRIPDGRDVSWIWDFDLEGLKIENITVSGDRTYDLALRLKYADINKFEIEPDLKKAIKIAIGKTMKNEILYILPTYSAMLEARKIITGKKIL